MRGTGIERFGIFVIAAVIASGCTGEGCDCIDELPAPFPELRKQTAGLVVRVTDSGLAVLETEAVDLIAERTGNDGPMIFPVPPQCSSDPSVCCGTSPGYCSMSFDLGDSIEIDSVGPDRLGVTLYPRVRTVRPMPARTYGPLGGAIDCWVSFDTAWSGSSRMGIYFEIILGSEATTGELRAGVSSASVWGASTGDISISGDFLCRFGSESDAVNRIMAGFRSQIPGAVAEMLCATCDADSDCGAGASCSADGVCEIDGTNRCQQSLGIDGRHQAGALLGSLLGGAVQKRLDLYLNAGSDARAENDGLSLAVTTGLSPATDPQTHRCVPVAPEPAISTLPMSTDLSGNTHPITGEPYDVGAAIHVDAINHGAWAAHQAGYICLNLGTARLDMLNTNSLALAAPSLPRIAPGPGDNGAPMFVLVRPSTPPHIALGADPQLDISLADLDLDFYALVDDRYARIFTATVDADFGVGLEVDGDGELMPVLGDPAEAITNVRVSDVSLLEETADEIAGRLPPILSLAISMAASDLDAPIELPALAGLELSLSAGAITAVDENTRLALFADIAGGATAPISSRSVAVDTQIDHIEVDDAAREIRLEVSDAGGGAVEWQYRLNGGFWSPFIRERSAAIAHRALEIDGDHRVEVRARLIDAPLTLDPTPVEADAVLGFHGAGDGGGCECNSSGSAAGGALVVLLAMLLGFARRRRLALLAVLGALGACGNDKPADPDDPNALRPGPTGKWASMATDGDRVVIAAYEAKYGDLVLAEVNGPGAPTFAPIAGVPGGPVTHEAGGYRGGVSAAGPDVGAHTSAGFAAGELVIAYQDRDRRSLMLWRDGAAPVELDAPAADTAEVARYTSLATAPGGAVGVAYLVVDRADEAVTTELRWWNGEAVESVATGEATPIDRVDLVPGAGLFPSAIIRADGTPAIAWYDSVAGALMLSTRGADGWATRTVDDQGDRGQWASLVETPSGELAVAYQDADADDLLVRTIGGEVEVVDTGVRDGERDHPVGASAHLIATTSELIVSYHDASANVAMIARRPIAGGAWERARAIDGNAGFYLGAASAGGSLWVSSYVYEHPIPRTEVTEL